MNKPLILVVEDDKAICNLITNKHWKHKGYQYHTAGTGKGSILEAVSKQPGHYDIGLRTSGHGRRGYY